MITEEQENSFTIHKDVLNFEDFNNEGYYPNLYPDGAEFLTVQMQKGKLCVWYQWDLGASEDEAQVKAILMIGTGWNVDKTKYKIQKYLGTVQMSEGTLVFHFFEVQVLGI